LQRNKDTLRVVITLTIVITELKLFAHSVAFSQEFTV